MVCVWQFDGQWCMISVQLGADAGSGSPAAFALLATPSGLWVGSDTTYIGNRQAFRGRVAFFPVAGGAGVPPTSTAQLPVTVVSGQSQHRPGQRLPVRTGRRTAPPTRPGPVAAQQATLPWPG